MGNHRDYLFSLEQLGVKLGLEQIHALVRFLDRPDLAYPSIVIAGTNGKGSVAAMVERGLRAAGFRTGRYTSPHLVHLEERFAVDGRPIAAEDLDRLAGLVRTAAERLPAPPTFFEATTAIALEAFRQARVRVAVLEVGLGGRLDATNVVQPTAVGVTSIDFDHEALLGSTLEAIAREKAGVIKAGSLVVLAANPPAVADVVRAASGDAGATLVSAEEGTRVEATVTAGRTRLSLTTPRAAYREVALALHGRHQIDNAVAAVRLLEELAARRGWRIPQAAVRAALEDVVWPGRLELIRYGDRDVLIDGAHNPAGARAFASYVRDAYGRLPLVVGVLRDKNIDAIVGALAPVASHFVFTAPATPRAAPPAGLADAARRVAPAIPASTAPRAIDAVRCALAFAAPVIGVVGSLYLAGEIRAEAS